MAAKTKINDYGDVIFSEEDTIDLLYADPEFNISKLYFKDVKKYSQSLKELGIDLPVIQTAPNRSNLADFDEENCNNWHMPDIDVKVRKKKCGYRWSMTFLKRKNSYGYYNF